MAGVRQMECCRCVPASVGVAPVELQAGEDITLVQHSLHATAPLFDLVQSNKGNIEHFSPWMVEQYKTLEDAFNNMLKVMERVKDRSMAPYQLFYEGAGPIGISNLHSRRGNQAKLGYMLDENYQHRGLATRACQRVVTFGFEDWELETISLHIDPVNLASRAVAMRLGAVIAGTTQDRDPDGSLRPYEIWEIHRG